MSNDNVTLIIIVLLCWAGCDSCSGCRRNVRELYAPCDCRCEEPAQ